MSGPVVPRDEVAAHLHKVLESAVFQGAERSCTLLRFLVERTLEDGADGLKEYTLGAEAFGKGEAFDPRTDPIVRAEASRLRGRLQRYYAGEGAGDRISIKLEKGSYVPRFEFRRKGDEVSRSQGEGGVRRGSGSRQRLGWFTLGAITVGIALALSLWLVGPAPPPPQRVAPLTALPGASMWPTFSPDGRQVAFVWSGDQPGNLDIYVKIIGTSEPLRITSDEAVDFNPEWSPDGRQIAFVRATSVGQALGSIHLASPLVGRDRRLGDWPALVGPWGGLSWSPDGRFLAAARAAAADDQTSSAGGIFLVPVEGGEPRVLTQAPPAGRHVAPALSPDGKHLAYAACDTREFTPCDVHLLDLHPDLRPKGSARRLTRQGLYSIHRIAWMPDGRSLLYDTEVGGHETFSTWRVGVDGTTPPERLEVAGVGAWLPAVRGQRVAFTRWLFDVDIVRFTPERPREAFLGSSYWDGSSDFSPDGRRIAFESMRSGARQEIWLASADGRDAVPLTDGPGRMQGSPAWSPDGRRIAFDSEGLDGHWDIWTIDVAGGAPRRLTSHPADEQIPEWSHDGRFVYFFTRREGARGIRRIPAEGGADERVLDLPAGTIAVTQASADSRTLYFTTGDSALFAHPLDGGLDRKLADCVRGVKGFSVAPRGVYYADCSGGWPRGPGRPDVPLHRLDLVTGEDRVLGTLQSFRGTGLTASPDEKTILYTSVTRTGADLMLIEGYR